MNSAIRKLRGPEIKYDSDEEKALIEKAAILEGLTVTAFIKSNAVKAARQAVAGHQQMSLSDADWDFLMGLLDNPPEPNEALKRLLKGD